MRIEFPQGRPDTRVETNVLTALNCKAARSKRVATIKTVRSKNDWRAMFRRLGYPGDYYFKVFTF